MFGGIKNIFLKMELRRKTWYFFMFILVCYLLGLGGIFIAIVDNQLSEYAKKNNRDVLLSISNNFTLEIEKANNFSRLLLITDEVTRYLCEDVNKLFEVSDPAYRAIYKAQNAFPNAASVFVLRKDGNYLNIGVGITKVDRELLKNEQWAGEIHEKKGGYLLQINGNGLFQTNNQRKVISLIRDVNRIDKMQEIGMLAVNIPISVLENSYSNYVKEEKQFAYVDNDGDFLCINGDENELSQVWIGDKSMGQRVEHKGFHKKIYSYFKIPDTEIVLLNVEEVPILEGMSSGYVPMMLLMLLLMILTFFAMQEYISHFITIPIQKMVGAMSYTETGIFRRASVWTGKDEIGQLKDSYNKMIREINDLIEQIIEKEKLIRKSEIEIVQQQIKPHFLYNTIETIACIALEDGNKKVYRALETLGGFYRQFLSKGNEIVKLSVEVEIIRSYMEIQRMRYDDIFAAEFDLEENYTDVQVPKLILQPIVENSLYHGIRPKGEEGIIRVKIWEDEQFVYIQIYDTGVGMSEETLAHIMEAENRSFGLRRTIERVQYYENREQVYEIESEEGAFTSITINIDKFKKNRA